MSESFDWTGDGIDFTDASPNQVDVWMASEISDERSLYNVYRAYRFFDSEKFPQIRSAIYSLAKRHAVFRYVFQFRDNLKKGEGPSEVPVITADVPEGLMEYLLSKAEEPFDLAAGPLARWHIVTSAESLIIMLVAHHIVCDGRSVEVIFDELAGLYRGESLSDPQMLASGGVVQYTPLEHVRSARPWIDWPQAARQSRSAESSSRDAGDVISKEVSLSLPALKRAAAAQRASFFSLVAGALLVALRGQGVPSPIGFAVPYAGRQLDDQCIGYFIENLKVAVNLKSDASLAKCVTAARDAILDAIEHRQIFSDSNEPFYPNLSINFYESATGDALAALGAEQLDIPVRTAKYDLAVAGKVDGERFSFLFSYRSSLLDRAWVEKLANRTAEILCKAEEVVDRPISDRLESDHETYLEMSRSIAAVWRDVLRLQHVALDDNFLEIGGYSLLAARIVSRLSEDFGRSVSLRDLFAAPTPQGLAQHLLQREGLESLETESNSFPITRQQSRLWYYSSSLAEDTYLTVSSTIRFDKLPDFDALKSAFMWVQRRHDSLRTRFVASVDGVQQVIEKEPVVELEFWETVLDNTSVREIIEQMRWEPFDLTSVPLRARVIPVVSGECFLTVAMHHAITDGWSMQLFFAGLAERYRAIRNCQEPAMRRSTQYSHYTLKQTAEDPADGIARLTYWRHALRGAKPPPVPTDFPREAWSFSGATESFQAPAEMRDTAGKVSAFLGISPTAFFVAAYYNALREFTHADDLLLMLIDANRSDPEFAACTGYFTNIVPIRLERVNNSIEFVRLVGGEIIAGIAHADVKLGQILDQIRGDADYRDYMRLGFDFFAEHRQTLDFGQQALPFEVAHDVAKYDFNLVVVYGVKGPIDIVLQYRTDLFRSSTAREFAELYLKALTKLSSDLLSSLPNRS